MLNFILKNGKKIFSILLISNHIKQNKVWEKKKARVLIGKRTLVLPFKTVKQKL